eukprot:gene9064-biopygen4568
MNGCMRNWCEKPPRSGRGSSHRTFHSPPGLRLKLPRRVVMYVGGGRITRYPKQYNDPSRDGGYPKQYNDPSRDAGRIISEGGGGVAEQPSMPGSATAARQRIHRSHTRGHPQHCAPRPRQGTPKRTWCKHAGGILA